MKGSGVRSDQYDREHQCLNGRSTDRRSHRRRMFPTGAERRSRTRRAGNIQQSKARPSAHMVGPPHSSSGRTISTLRWPRERDRTHAGGAIDTIRANDGTPWALMTNSR